MAGVPLEALMWEVEFNDRDRAGRTFVLSFSAFGRSDIDERAGRLVFETNWADEPLFQSAIPSPVLWEGEVIEPHGFVQASSS